MRTGEQNPPSEMAGTKWEQNKSLAGYGLRIKSRLYTPVEVPGSKMCVWLLTKCTACRHHIASRDNGCLVGLDSQRRDLGPPHFSLFQAWPAFFFFFFLQKNPCPETLQMVSISSKGILLPIHTSVAIQS